MTRKGKKYLFDILQSIQLIEDHIKDVPDLETYVSDIKTQDAVERRLIIISEALRRLNQIGVVLSKSDSLINRRNTIVHQYDQFSPEAIWRSVLQELPPLKQEAEQLIAEEP